MYLERTFAEPWSDYALIDAGGGKKLERWGEIITIRPEVQAYFKPEKPIAEWKKLAHWEFYDKGNQKGEWKSLKVNAPDQWIIAFESLRFQLNITQFKHLGLFPEQVTNWRLFQDLLDEKSRFLNLFAYTGAASCVAKKTQADVVHVDSIKQLINWASTNMELSGLSDIRWVLDDALKFAGRALRRGDRFDGIIMDPPAWGLGSKKEKWRLEDKLPELMKTAADLLSENGVLVLNTYSPQVNAEDILKLSESYLHRRNNELTELWMKAESGKELYFGLLLRSFPQNAQ